MAPIGKPLSLSFLLLLLSSLQVQARESQFFSKTTRYDVTNLVDPTRNQEYLTTTKDENQNSYGLYGQSSNPTTTYTNKQFDAPAEFQNKQYDSNQWFNADAEYNEPATERKGHAFSGSATARSRDGKPTWTEGLVGEQRRDGYTVEEHSDGYNAYTTEGRGGYKSFNGGNNGGYYGSTEIGNEYKNTVGGYQNVQQNELQEGYDP